MEIRRWTSDIQLLCDRWNTRSKQAKSATPSRKIQDYSDISSPFPILLPEAERNHEFLYPVKVFWEQMCKRFVESPVALPSILIRHQIIPAYHGSNSFPLNGHTRDSTRSPISRRFLYFPINARTGHTCSIPTNRGIVPLKIQSAPFFAARPLESRAFHFRLLPLCRFRRLLSLSRVSHVHFQPFHATFIFLLLFQFLSVRRDENHFSSNSFRIALLLRLNRPLQTGDRSFEQIDPEEAHDHRGDTLISV